MILLLSLFLAFLAACLLTERARAARDIAAIKEKTFRKIQAVLDARDRPAEPVWSKTETLYSPGILATEPPRIPHGAPSSLGLKLCIKTFNTKRWETEEAARSNAAIGSVFELLTTEVVSEPTWLVTYLLVRIQSRQRWMQLTVYRLEEEPLAEVVVTYLQTLDPEWLARPIHPSPGVHPQWVLWNPSTESWDTP